MYIRAYNHYKHGFLPNDGSWLSQPAKLLDAFSVIEKVVSSMEKEKERKKRAFKR